MDEARIREYTRSELDRHLPGAVNDAVHKQFDTVCRPNQSETFRKIDALSGNVSSMSGTVSGMAGDVSEVKETLGVFLNGKDGNGKGGFVEWKTKADGHFQSHNDIVKAVTSNVVRVVVVFVLGLLGLGTLQYLKDNFAPITQVGEIKVEVPPSGP